MNEISCQVCQDLMPLVKDGVASEGSRDAVIRHVAACEACRRLFEGVDDLEPQMDDKRVMARIKNQLAFAALIIVIVGALIGVGIADSDLVFYNIIIMPTVGALGYIALREKAHLVPLAMLPFVYVWHFIKYMLSGDLSYQVLLFSPLFWGLIYAGLCALGVIVAALLGFAFKKEDRSDANII